jgi:hypothetical protein
MGKILVNMPMARSRSAPNWSETMPVADGMNAPPPSACSARRVTSS